MAPSPSEADPHEAAETSSTASAAPREFYIDANPDKRVVTTTAQVYPPDLALFELIDNSIDAWRGNGRTSPLVVEINIDFSQDKDLVERIVVSDNAGGVPDDRLRALLQPGAANLNQDAIGTWGQGLKVATYALAKDIDIKTRYRDGPLTQIRLDDAWWKSAEWRVRVLQFQPTEFPVGRTEITLAQMRNPLSRAEVYAPGETTEGTLLERISQTYTPLLSGALNEQLTIEVVIDGERHVVQPGLLGNERRVNEFFAFPPGYEPTRHVITFRSGPRSLRVEALVGLLPEQSRKLSGVTMYGKGRLFEFALKENKVGFGTRGPAKIPASHPTTWRLVVLVFFEGAPSVIPWRSPAKFGYNENNEFHRSVRDFLVEITEPYAIFTRLAKRLDIVPYSMLWNSLPAERREKEIRQYSGASRIEAILAENPQLTSSFAGGEILALDHDSPISTERPATSTELSHKVAKWLRSRDTSEPKSLWTTNQLAELARPGARMTIQIAKRKADEDDPWLHTHRLTISLPQPLYQTVLEAAGGESLSDWIRKAIDERAGIHDGIHHIPSLTFRRAIHHARERLLAALPDADGIMIFGSVARGSEDRESDIDMLIVHEDKIRAQQTANRVLANFKLRTDDQDERYTINPLVLSPRSFQEQARSGAKFQQSLDEGVWIFAKEGFDPKEPRP